MLLPNSIFITGTDTGIGKTLISSLLLRKERSLGYSVAGFKPIASGAVRTEQGLRNLDAQLLMHAMSISLPYDVVNPVTIEPPIAPHIGLKHIAGYSEIIDIDQLVQGAYQQLPNDVDLVFIEGAGGWRVPINDTHNFSDLASAYRAKVIMVVGMKLGCINHALLTAEAIERDGSHLIGWIANCVEPDMPYLEDNIHTIETRLSAPRLMTVPFINPLSPQLSDGQDEFAQECWRVDRAEKMLEGYDYQSLISCFSY